MGFERKWHIIASCDLCVIDRSGMQARRERSTMAHHPELRAGMKTPVKSIVVLPGAGISAESGIRTFRGSDGLWEDHRIEDVATPEGFQRDPVLVHRFYNERRSLLLSNSIRPNPAHVALANFERAFPGNFLLVTQNIDNLHERAGSRKVVHMHGELLRMRCQISGRSFDIRGALTPDTACQCCRQPGNLRPDIVWFGEMPYHMPQIMHALENCQLFIAIGTSGNVYPASGFYQTARIRRALTVEINLEETGSAFDEHVCGPASVVLPEYLDTLLRTIRQAQSISGNSSSGK